MSISSISKYENYVSYVEISIFMFIMANTEHYKRWLEIKNQFQKTLLEDSHLQECAINYIGFKPQGTAVETVARVYAQYCKLYNGMCDCYDQMGQVQRRPFIKTIIDALTCRIIEIKKALEEVEVFEYTYPDNALQQMLIIPQEIEIVVPYFYPFEIREAEKQYIMDQIFSGNRIGDPPLTESELLIKEQQEREEAERLEQEKLAEQKRLMTLGFDIVSEHSEHLTPEEMEIKRLKEEYETHIFNIQRMERSRIVTRGMAHAKFKDENLYLVLTGLKKPSAVITTKLRAVKILQTVLRTYMKLKREHLREKTRREILDMCFSSCKKLSAKEQLELIKELKRKFRRSYYEDWLRQCEKEKARVFRLREGDIMEDISDETRQWLFEWFERVHVFDEFPWPEEGGTIVVVKGETMTIPEYLEWKEEEEKRLKAQAGKEKSKEQIKEEKAFERQEKKRIAAEAKIKEKKRIEDYRKARRNPDNDPGVYMTIGQHIKNLELAWASYQIQWKGVDEPDPQSEAIKGFLMEFITETAYQDLNIELRPIVDDAMRLEYAILKAAMVKDYDRIGLKPPMTLKRKKPKKKKNPKPDKISAEIMFQTLADEGIVRQYPRVTLDDFWGDRNYMAAEARAVLWKPKFPPPCLGDVREQVRNRCLLTIGASCQNISKAQLIVGPKGCGKKSLVYAVATETNALLVDLSPLQVYNKFPGPKNTKTMWTYINKISRIMQPTVILVDCADKLFYKKVPKEEKMFDPTRLSKDFYAQIIKPIGEKDKIIVMGTATEPWLAAKPKMVKVFPDVIMIPRSDYGSLTFILTQMLMGYHGVDREFNVHSLAQVLRGYDINSIKKAVETVVAGKRLAQLAVKPLQPREILNAVLENANAVCVDDFDTEMFWTWYVDYSPWGAKYTEYMLMLESQLAYKEKADKKK